MKAITCLVWLEWPEKCFCVNAKTLSFLKNLLPENSTLIRAKTEKAFLRALPGATHAIVWNFKKEWFQLAKNLNVLATPGAGRELVEWRDSPKNIQIHFGGFHGKIIAETVVGFMLARAHGFFHPALDEAKNEPWNKSWPRTKMSNSCFCIAGTNAVIAGYGKIGKTIGLKLEALGVNVSGFGRAGKEEFLKAAQNADWLIMALPSDTGTDDFLDKKLISKLPKRCIVINIGRGNSINEEALINALNKKRLAGAYLDVFKEEPGPLSMVGSGVSKSGRQGAAVPPNCGVAVPPNCGGVILRSNPATLPDNLIKMPHSSAFCDDYLKFCFEELKNDGIF